MRGQRLDHEYMLRSSEYPLLKKKPSDYMRDMYYASQPMEAESMRALECTLEMINAETQLLYASDLSALGLRAAVPDPGSGLPLGKGQAQHPRRVSGPAVQAAAAYRRAEAEPAGRLSGTAIATRLQITNILQQTVPDGALEGSLQTERIIAAHSHFTSVVTPPALQFRRLNKVRWIISSTMSRSLPTSSARKRSTK
jgi:hypothetical protein